MSVNTDPELEWTLLSVCLTISFEWTLTGKSVLDYQIPDFPWRNIKFINLILIHPWTNSILKRKYQISDFLLAYSIEEISDIQLTYNNKENSHQSPDLLKFHQSKNYYSLLEYPNLRGRHFGNNAKYLIIWTAHFKDLLNEHILDSVTIKD